jgi:drug/metabolite transporter (DMT)-like permease
VKRREAFGVPLLVAATAAWGSTFVVVKYAVSRMQVLDFLAWRFVIATAILVAMRPKAVARIDRSTLRRGILLGLSLAGGYIAQTYGLRYTSAASSGFITGMFVVFTPILMGLLLHRRVGGAAWVAVALATAGLGIISLHGFSLNFGDVLTLLCAFLYAFQLVGLAEWSADHDPYALAIVQLGTVGMAMTLVQAPFGLGPPASGGVWAAVLITAIPATAIAFVVQTWAQSLMSATRAAVVLTMEPVFAGLTAAIAGEALGWRVFVGGALVVAAMYLVELGGRERARQSVSVPALADADGAQVSQLSQFHRLDRSSPSDRSSPLNQSNHPSLPAGRGGSPRRAPSRG